MTQLKLKHTNKSYSDYRKSGIDWLGDVPRDWKVLKFKGVFSVSNERVKDNNGITQLLSVSGYRGVEEKNVDTLDGQMPSEDVGEYRIVRPGQLVVNTMWLNYVGLGVSRYAGYVSPAYRAYRPSKDMEPSFAHYLMRSGLYVQKYSSLLYGIRPNSLQVKPKDFEVIEILVPPLLCQKVIASFLDEKTALIDLIIEKKKKQIELLKEKRAAVINQAVTKGLEKNVEMVDSGVDWIGKVPKGWNLEKIKHLVKTMEAGVWGNDPVEDGYNIKCLRVADFDYENLAPTRVDTVRSNPVLPQRKLLRVGDILVEKSGGGEKTPVGRAILFNIKEKMVCANFIEIIRLHPEKVLPEFLVLYLSCIYAGRLNLKYIKQNTGIQNIDIHQYFQELVAFPEKKKQLEIVQAMEKNASIHQLTIKAAERSIDLLREFKSSLITNVVTGKIRV